MKKELLTLILFIVSLYGFSQSEPNILENDQALKNVLSKKDAWGEKVFIGVSKLDSPIYAYYYNRGGTDKAMIIGGVHGSEFYGVNVVKAIMDSLKNKDPKEFKWEILILPEIFPDNVQKGRNNIFIENYGRKTCPVCHGVDDEDKCSNSCVDPNRQMPRLDSLFRVGMSTAYKGKPIEIENQFLLSITQTFNPSRIVSIHCKNGIAEWMTKAEKQEHKAKNGEIGIFADPRTITKQITKKDNKKGLHHIALNYHFDEMLVLKMAIYVKENGGIITGNFIKEKYVEITNNKTKQISYKLKDVSYLNTVYPLDPAAVEKDFVQKRNYEDSAGYEKKNGMVSYGTWASTQIQSKNAAIMLTIELPQYYSFFPSEFAQKGKSDQYILDKIDLSKLNLNTSAYVNAVTKYFLEE